MQKYHGKEYELKISRIKMSDKGVYTVIAENSFGKREEHGTLKVEGLYLSMNCFYLLQKQKSI
jgi:hypothetical protein